MKVSVSEMVILVMQNLLLTHAVDDGMDVWLPAGCMAGIKPEWVKERGI